MGFFEIFSAFFCYQDLLYAVHHSKEELWGKKALRFYWKTQAQ